MAGGRKTQFSKTDTYHGSTTTAAAHRTGNGLHPGTNFRLSPGLTRRLSLGLTLFGLLPAGRRFFLVPPARRYGGFSTATHLSPLATSSVLHSSGQTRSVCLVRPSTRDVVTVRSSVAWCFTVKKRAIADLVASFRFPSGLPVSLQPRRTSCVCAARTSWGRERNHRQREPKADAAQRRQNHLLLPPGCSTPGSRMWREADRGSPRENCGRILQEKPPRPHQPVDQNRSPSRHRATQFGDFDQGLSSRYRPSARIGDRTRFRCSRDSSQRA